MEASNKRLLDLQSQIDELKKNMVSKDEILNSDEFEAYLKSFEKENLVSFEDALSELDISLE